MLSYYLFKPKSIKAVIIFVYDFDRKKAKILLSFINIYKTEKEALNYVKKKGLQSSKGENQHEREILENMKVIFQKYFSGELKDLYNAIQEIKIDLDLKSKFNTDFSRAVLNELLNVKPGETTSYYEIGKKIDSKAYRAIGNACKSNPIPLIVPCHRVLKKSGEVGGFMGKTDKDWETNLKKELLKLEGAKF
jgi:methylated-DNA-[protein]-cysteine S-methyltransferase